MQVEALTGLMEELHTHTRTLKANEDATFTEPVRRFNNVYKHVEFHAKQRELKLQEYEKQQARLEKLERKALSQSGPGMQAKLDQTQRALTSSRADYERVQSRMMQEMPVLYQQRVGYFEFCLQAAIKSQALHYRECSRSLHDTLSKLRGSSELMTEEEITRNTEKCLADIRSLSIVGGTQGL